MTAYTITEAQRQQLKDYLRAQCGKRCNEEYNPCEAQELETMLQSLEPVKGKAVAYITETEQGPMVWTPEMYGEACTYCDDGEFPVPLYTNPLREFSDEQVQRAMTAICDASFGDIQPTMDEMRAALEAAEKARGEK